MVAQQTNLDVIANNLANVNTNAFKSVRAEFQDMMYQSLRPSGAEASGTVRAPSAIQVGLGTRYAGNSINFSQGGMQNTNNPYDLAITGEGFFAIELPDGTTGYSRDGSFRRNAEGRLVTTDGLGLVPEIIVPSNATSFIVSTNGQVVAQIPGQDQPQALGQITLTLFPNPSGLTRVGKNLYRAGGASGEPQIANPGENGAGSIQGGFLEGSNVSIVEEMVRMISAQRAYEINSRAIQTADDMLGTLNQLKR